MSKAATTFTGHKLRTFTSWKLDFLTCLAADPRIKPMVFEVAFCISQHIKASTRLAFVSDQTVREKTNISERDVYRARRRLKETGWLDWRRTSTANVYSFSDANMNGVRDALEIRRQARQDRRRYRQSVRTRESEHVRTRESDIHLRGTPYSE
jgi:hypothetical protein